jgi:hypothetical protein
MYARAFSEGYQHFTLKLPVLFLFSHVCCAQDSWFTCLPLVLTLNKYIEGCVDILNRLPILGLQTASYIYSPSVKVAYKMSSPKEYNHLGNRGG